jgi:hypothetical protein
MKTQGGSQMRRQTNASALCVAAAGTFCFAATASGLEPGEYEVSVGLELPHVEDTGVVKVTRICVTESDNGTHGLVVLSDNNPLGRCPASNVREGGGTLIFDIICPGGNAAVGSARYTLRARDFDGVITMKMGGKNMTMIERQSGHRAGSCEAN